MADVTIRRARADEWEAFREVRLAALADSPDAFAVTLEEEREEGEAHWRSWITGEGWAGAVATFVADGAGSFAGMAVGFHPENEPLVVHLFAMWVAPDHRKEGIGRGLVAAVARWAADRSGVDQVLFALRSRTTTRSASARPAAS